MPTKKEIEMKKRIKYILATIIGIIAFILCIVTTIRGMKQTINNEPERTGMVRFFS